MTVAMLKGTQELDERAFVSAARGGYVRLRRSREDRHRQEKSEQREFAFHPDLLKSIAHNGVLCEAALGEVSAAAGAISGIELLFTRREIRRHSAIFRSQHGKVFKRINPILDGCDSIGLSLVHAASSSPHRPLPCSLISIIRSQAILLKWFIDKLRQDQFFLTSPI